MVGIGEEGVAVKGRVANLHPQKENSLVRGITMHIFPNNNSKEVVISDREEEQRMILHLFLLLCRMVVAESMLLVPVLLLGCVLALAEQPLLNHFLSVLWDQTTCIHVCERNAWMTIVGAGEYGKHA